MDSSFHPAVLCSSQSTVPRRLVRAIHIAQAPWIALSRCPTQPAPNAGPFRTSSPALNPAQRTCMRRRAHRLRVHPLPPAVAIALPTTLHAPCTARSTPQSTRSVRSAIAAPPPPHAGVADASTNLSAVESWAEVLSVGEQQRVAFLRLLRAAPALAVLDEATSAMDTATEHAMYSLLRAHCASFVSVGHRPQLEQYHTHVLQWVGPGRWQLRPSATYVPVGDGD